MITKLLQQTIKLWLFLLPWQTIWIISEATINGSKWQYGTEGFYATQLLGWGIIILWIMYYLKRWSQTHNRKMVSKQERLFFAVMGVFIAYLFLSSTVAAIPVLAWQQALIIAQALIMAIIVISPIIATKEIINALIAGAIIQSMLAIYQFIFQTTFSSTLLGITAHPAHIAGTSIVANDTIGRWVRSYGAFAHPNILGGYLAINITILLYYLLQVKKYTYSVCFSTVMLSIGLFTSMSRSAWIMVFLAVLYTLSIAILHKKKIVIKTIIVGIVSVGIFGIIYMPLINTRVTGEQSTHEMQSITERVNQYQEWGSVIKTHPFIGVGGKHYTYEQFIQQNIYPGWTYQPIHNGILLFIAEWGILGFIL